MITNQMIGAGAKASCLLLNMDWNTMDPWERRKACAHSSAVITAALQAKELAEWPGYPWSPPDVTAICQIPQSEWTPDQVKRIVEHQADWDKHQRAALGLTAALSNAEGES